MKKTLSVLLTALMTFSQIPSALAEDSLEKALLEVKEKVYISDEFTEFETRTGTFKEGETFYEFDWSDSEGEKNIRVSTDQYGYITGYSHYDADWYKNYNDDSRKINTDFKIEELGEKAAEELKKLVPDLFESERNRLVPVEYTASLSTNPKSSFTFEFVREYEGIEVKDNYAYVTMFDSKDGYVMTDATVNWDYTSEFLTTEDVIGEEKAEELLAEINPLELSYRKTYDDKYLLEYKTENICYVAVDTGEEIKEDEYAEIYRTTNSAGGMLNFKEESALDAQVSLTPTEIAELEKVNGLKTKDELLEILYSMPELKVPEVVYPDYIRSYTGKSDDCYYTTLHLGSNVYYAEDEEITEPLSFSATFDAKTGVLISFNRNLWNDETKNVIPKEEGDKKADDFLNKYFSDKLADCKKSPDADIYVRQINDISYFNNTVFADWDLTNDCVSSFYSAWDSDISLFPDPDGIITEDKALEIMYEKYPVKKLFVMTDGMFRQVYTNSAYYLQLNAFSGKFTDYDGEEITDMSNGVYSDTQGHWVENIAKKLAEYGIALEGNELMPNNEITQGEFLNLVYNGVIGGSNPDIDYLYKRIINLNIISEEEMNSTATLTKENAICYLLRAMDIKEVAELSGIYICDFKDADSISHDKIGYCAIAKGFGIVNGSDGYLYPQKNITRAEALAMIYSYLTR